MIKFKIDVSDALRRKGYNTYNCGKWGLISQGTFTKLENEDTRISVETLNTLCYMLDMDLKSIIEFVEDEQEKELLLKRVRLKK